MFNRTMDEHTEKPHSNDGYIAIIKFARIDDAVYVYSNGFYDKTRKFARKCIQILA